MPKQTPLRAFGSKKIVPKSSGSVTLVGISKMVEKEKLLSCYVCDIKKSSELHGVLLQRFQCW